MRQLRNFTKEYQLVFSGLQNCKEQSQLKEVNEHYNRFKRKWRQFIESNDPAMRQLSEIYDRELKDHFVVKSEEK